MAHITGGGLIENVPRVLPAGTRAVINTSAWQPLEIFDWLQKHGNVEPTEMYRTFNCGIGMVLIVNSDKVDGVSEKLESLGEMVIRLGVVETRNSEEAQVQFGNPALSAR